MQLFGIPIYRKKIKISKKTIDKIKKEKYELFPREKNGYYTKSNVFILDQYKELKKQIEEEKNKFIYEDLKVQTDIDFKMINSWFIKHKPKNHSGIHQHVNSFISGILYLDVGPETGALTFYKDNMWRNVFPNTFDVKFTSYNEINSASWTFIPENGEVFLFPSFLQHAVSVNKTDKDRYSCAFNFYPQGLLMHEDLSQLCLNVDM